MTIPEQVKKMIDERWCFTCTMHLQSCINAGRCIGDKKRGDTNERNKNTV